jgi:hypothetical protein
MERQEAKALLRSCDCHVWGCGSEPNPRVMMSLLGAHSLLSLTVQISQSTADRKSAQNEYLQAIDLHLPRREDSFGGGAH